MSAKKRTIDAFFGSAAVAAAAPGPKSDKRPRIEAPSHAPEGSTPSLWPQAQRQKQKQEKEQKRRHGATHHATYPFPIPHLPPDLAADIAALPGVGTADDGNDRGGGSDGGGDQRLSSSSSAAPIVIADQPDLDLLYYAPLVPRATARQLFEFLRAELPFYRVEYDIRRRGPAGGGKGGTAAAAATAPQMTETQHIRTPRWTTVFGIDETSRFTPLIPSPPPETTPPSHGGEDCGQHGGGEVVDAATRSVVPRSTTTTTAADQGGQQKQQQQHPAYARYAPRPIPACLETLRRAAERATGARYNFCLVNYYADGRDSISYHSDDERFLGDRPAIASLSLGAPRDFLMKHKRLPAGPGPGNKGGSGGSSGSGKLTSFLSPSPHAAAREQEKKRGDGSSSSVVRNNNPAAAPAAATTAKPLKFPLGSGDMVLMRGATQANWLHSVPKRGENAAGGFASGSGGRINITFRRAMVKAGTDNYYNYNVGNGPVHKWDPVCREMRPWAPPPKSSAALGG